MIDPSARTAEVSEKLSRLRRQMLTRKVDAVVLTQLPNIAWLTAGASTYINLASDSGPSSLVITQQQAYVLTDNIEVGRLEQEEELNALGFTLSVEPWDQRGTLLASLLPTSHVGQDGPGIGTDLSLDLQYLRTHLQQAEVERLQSACSLASKAMAAVMYAIRPGMTETAIAGMLAAECLARGGDATVNLIASDERIARYRHPLPTRKPVERFVMVILCMRYQGLIAALTRLVYFGTLPDEIMRTAQTMARVDAHMIEGTRAGKTLGAMFTLAEELYSKEGYPTAAAEHHQGGLLAYLPREILVRAQDPTVIAENQAFAWNPSIRGAKSEDTMLLTSAGPVILTQTDGWPTWSVTVNNQTLLRPAILEQRD